VPAVHASRRAALRAKLPELNLNALLITNLLNVRYLTGFTGSNAALVVVADGAPPAAEPNLDRADGSEPGTILCTDGRYRTQAAAQTPDLDRLIERASALALLQRYRSGRWGFEAGDVTVAGHQQLAAAAGAVDFVPTNGTVEGLREVKDATEIEALRRACEIADTAFAHLIADDGVRPGRTEREVGLDLDERMRRLGAEDPAFETIVAAGANSAIPHHRPTAAELKRGDLVKFDFGARFAGYHSDMTRTVVLGEPAPWQQEIYDLVLAAQTAAEAVSRPGAQCAAVDGAARQVIVDAGYGDTFVHGLGHGVGLEIHEAPAVAATATGTMAEDMVLTIEPGVYLEGRGGVRIEDSGVVRASGYEVLTLTAKNLLVL
jgi:Xaa-Pro aminopeptidase